MMPSGLSVVRPSSPFANIVLCIYNVRPHAKTRRPICLSFSFFILTFHCFISLLPPGASFPFFFFFFFFAAFVGPVFFTLFFYWIGGVRVCLDLFAALNTNSNSETH